VEQIAAACDCESLRVGPGSAGEASLADKLATGEANIVGSQEKLIDFLSLMDNFDSGLISLPHSFPQKISFVVHSKFNSCFRGSCSRTILYSVNIIYKI
jgi:hypothetical protein